MPKKTTNKLAGISKLPDAPGVYFFRGERQKILYVGKATSLKSRVKSYFSKDLAETRGPLITELMQKARSVTFEKTDSVLEALILEAHYIKKYQPPYNTLAKDDKSFNYVIVTKEDFPRVLVVRGKELVECISKKDIKYQFGPFPHGLSLKEAMRLIRKIFPYRDTCTPASGSVKIIRRRASQKIIKHRVFDKDSSTPCFNAQIGLCPGVCSGMVTRAEYAKTIRNIKLLFEGKKKALVRQLARDMKGYAKAQAFEKAAEARRQIFALEHIQDVALIKRELKLPEYGRGSYRIEAYDVAHISGTGTVGVFTVVEDGYAKKSDYRMFRIRRAVRGSDTGALVEVLERRLMHPEWPLPKLIAVDGGVAQKNAAERVLSSAGVLIPVVAVVKDERHRPREILGEGREKHERERGILLANSEAHRFAVTYHRKIR